MMSIVLLFALAAVAVGCSESCGRCERAKSATPKAPAALPMPSGKATVTSGLAQGDAVATGLPVRAGNVITCLNKRLEINPSGGVTLAADDETVFTCGPSYVFTDMKTGNKQWGGFGKRDKKYSRIASHEENGVYVSEGWMRASSGEEYLQHRATASVTPEGLVKLTYQAWPGRDPAVVKIENIDYFYFGGGEKTLPGSTADFGGKTVAFDEKPSFAYEYRGRLAQAKDCTVTYYKDNPCRAFSLTLKPGYDGKAGWGVWQKGKIHGSFQGPGEKTLYLDLRKGVRRVPNPNVRGGIDWRAIEGLTMPEQRANTLQNPSFERGWRCWDTAAFAQGFMRERWTRTFFELDDTVAHSGRRSMKCYAYEDPVPGNCERSSMEYAYAPALETSLCTVTDPGTWTVSFWAKATSTNVFAKFWCPPFSYVRSAWGISRWVPRVPGANGNVRLSTEWRRYHATFDLPQGDPLKLVFKFVSANGGGAGFAWVDDVQIERSALTPYAAPAAEAELVMSDPDQFCELGAPLKARLVVHAAEPGTMKVEVKSFLDEPIFTKTYAFTPGKADGANDGRGTRPACPSTGCAVVELPELDGVLPGAGVYKMRRTFALDSGKTAFEDDRFTVARSLDGRPRKWRFLQSQYWRVLYYHDVLSLFARWRRLGIDALYGSPDVITKEGAAFVREHGIEPGVPRVASTGLYESVPDPKNPRQTVRRRLKGPAVFAVDLDYGKSEGIAVTTNSPRMTTYALSHKQLGVPMDAAYLKRLEDAAAAKVARFPWISEWECSSEINCGLGYAYWSEDNDWEHQMQNFSKWLAALYRGAKRGNPKAVVSNDSAMNMSPSCIEEIKATLRYCAKEGVKFDAIGAHTYRYAPEDPDLDDGFKSLTDEAVRLGYSPDVPFVCGEGMHWGPYEVRAWKLQCVNWQEPPERWWDEPSALSYDIGRTERRSAAWRMRSWLVAYKYAHRMRYMNSGNTNNFELDGNRTPFLSQIVSSVLVNLLGNSTYLADVRFAPYCRAYVFRDEKGRGIAAVWNHKPAVDESREDAPRVAADFGDALEKVLDMVGSRRAFAGRGEFAVTPEPLFFISKPGREQDLIAAVRKLRVVSGSLADRAEVAFNPVAPDKTGVVVKEFTGETVKSEEKIASPLAYDRATTVRCAKAEADYSAFLVKRVAEDATAATVDWTKVPAIPLTNRTGKPSEGFAASQQLAWSGAALFLRVTVKDRTFVHVADPKTSNRYDNDALQVCLDAQANGRFNHRKGFDDDDYVYDVFPDPDGKSARAFRRHAADMQLSLGIYTPKCGIFADELPATFERTSDGYVYTLTMPAKYVLPLRLEKGRVLGFGIYVSDASDPKLPFGKRCLGGFSNVTVPGKTHYDHPERWPAALLWE